jgi:S-adenosylmethionine hydrolase
MPPALVTLTTDFGSGSSYVAAMKGALLSVNPQATIVDLTHDLPPQDLVATSYFLADALPYFPAGTIHVVVVDPGVGADRSLLCVEWNQQLLLAPDNGCWTSLEPLAREPLKVYRLSHSKYWRSRVSSTFHGRDIIAPVAGHLTLGVSPSDLGPRVESWVRLELPKPIDSESGLQGQVVMIDRFGNLITNLNLRPDQRAHSVQIGSTKVPRIVRTYGDCEPGDLVALIGSSGRLEIAEVNGSAARLLQLGVGTPVAVEFG